MTCTIIHSSQRLSLAFALLLGAAACKDAHGGGPGGTELGQNAAGNASGGSDAGASHEHATAGSGGAAGTKQTAGTGSATAGKPSDGTGGAGKQADRAGNGSAGNGSAGKTGDAGQGAAGKSAVAGAGGKRGEAGTGGKPMPAAGSGGTGKRCGTRGGAVCASDQFCNFEPDAECGATDKGGVCEAVPDVCITLYKPVCGCDNRTYSLDCVAHSHGVSVKHAEACNASECESVGGRAVLSNGASTPVCKANEESTAIGGAIEGGLCCLPRPAAKTCGGIAALKCQDGEFCNYEPEAGGQGCDGKVADAGGKCQAKPGGCTRDSMPVCGCDHRSYGNLCSAHEAGASLLHKGYCTVSDCKAVGGRDVAGIGPAPMCAADEREFTSIINDNGSMAIEGMLCCVKK